MSWKNKVFADFKLYAVTDLNIADAAQLEKIESVYRGGADIVQLRSKCLSDAALYSFGLAVRALADRYQKLYFVNDRLDLAFATHADGVHLGQNDLPIAEARRVCASMGKPLWIGKSTHNPDQGKAALGEHPDYIGVGPVFETPTKPGYRPAGLEYVREAASWSNLPFVAIGGIHPDNLEQVLQAGARRVAVVRGLFESSDPYKTSLEMREKIESCVYDIR